MEGCSYPVTSAQCMQFWSTWSWTQAFGGFPRVASSYISRLLVWWWFLAVSYIFIKLPADFQLSEGKSDGGECRTFRPMVASRQASFRTCRPDFVFDPNFENYSDLITFSHINNLLFSKRRNHRDEALFLAFFED